MEKEQISKQAIEENVLFLKVFVCSQRTTLQEVQ